MSFAIHCSHTGLRTVLQTHRAGRYTLGLAALNTVLRGREAFPGKIVHHRRLQFAALRTPPDFFINTFDAINYIMTFRNSAIRDLGMIPVSFQV